MQLDEIAGELSPGATAGSLSARWAGTAKMPTDEIAEAFTPVSPRVNACYATATLRTRTALDVGAHGDVAQVGELVLLGELGEVTQHRPDELAYIAWCTNDTCD